MKFRRALVALFNLAVVAGFAWAIQHWWGWGRLLAPWRTIPITALGLAVAGMLASYAIRAARIFIAEPEIPHGAYLDCLRLVMINSTLNLLLPARSGEASFPILLKRWFGIDAARGTGTLFWLRLLDLHVLATIGAACAAAGWQMPGAAGSRIAWLVAILAAFAPLLAFALHGPLSRAFAARPGKLFELLRRALLGMPDRGIYLARDLAMTWASWIVKLAALGWVLAQMADLSPALGVLGVIGGDLSTVLPVHAPGGFGTYEAGVLALLAPAAAAGDHRWSALLAGAVDLHLLMLTVGLGCAGLSWISASRTHRPAVEPQC